MALALVSAATPVLQSSNATTTGAIALTSTIPSGALVLVHVGGHLGASTPTLGISDTQSQSWTALTPVTQSTGSSTITGGFFTILSHALTAGTDTITVTSTVTRQAIVTISYITGASSSGLAASLVPTSSTSNPTTYTFGSVTGVTNGLSVVWCDTAAAVTTLSTFSPSGFSQFGSVDTSTGTNSRTAFEMSDATDTGSISPTVHTNSGQHYTSLAFVISPASASATVTGVTATAVAVAPAGAVSTPSGSITGPTAVASFAGTGNSTSTGAIALGTTVPVGALCLVHVGGSYGATSTFGIIDSQSHTWTALPIATQTSGANSVTTGFFTVIQRQLTAGTDTITCSRSSTGTPTVTIEYWTNTAGLDGSAITASVSTASTTVTFPAITATGGDVVLVWSDTGSAVTTLSSISSGFSQEYLTTSTGSNNRTSFSLINSTASGSITPSCHTNNGQDYSALVFALAPSGTSANVAGVTATATAVAPVGAVQTGLPDFLRAGVSGVGGYGTGVAPTGSVLAIPGKTINGYYGSGGTWSRDQLAATTFGFQAKLYKFYCDFSTNAAGKPGASGSAPLAAAQAGSICHLRFDPRIYSNVATQTAASVAAQPAGTGTNPYPNPWFGYDDIISGGCDPVIKQIAHSISAMPGTHVVDFGGEPDLLGRRDGSAKTSPALFSQAWRYFMNGLKANGCTNFEPAWVMAGTEATPLNFSSSVNTYVGSMTLGALFQMYYGVGQTGGPLDDQAVLWIGNDPYISNAKAASTILAFNTWVRAGNLTTAAKSKNFMLGEWGIGADYSTNAARVAVFAQIPPIIGAYQIVEYFDSDFGGASDDCDVLGTTDGSIAAYISMSATSPFT